MIERQVVVPAGPEQVWEALTDPARTEAWLGGRIDWDLEAGSVLRFVSDEGAVREGRIEEIDPGRYLRFAWWPAGEPAPAGPSEPGEEPPSEVQYVLEPEGDGTLLTVRELTPAASAASACEAPLATVAAGWTAFDQVLFEIEAAAMVFSAVRSAVG